MNDLARYARRHEPLLLLPSGEARSRLAFAATREWTQSWIDRMDGVRASGAKKREDEIEVQRVLLNDARLRAPAEPHKESSRTRALRHALSASEHVTRLVSSAALLGEHGGVRLGTPASAHATIGREMTIIFLSTPRGDGSTGLVRGSLSRAQLYALLLYHLPDSEISAVFERVAQEMPSQALKLLEEGIHLEGAPDEVRRRVLPPQAALAPLLGHEERDIRARAVLALGAERRGREDAASRRLR